MSAKILVVDDTPMNVKMLADVLTFKGYQVVTAGGGKEGLAKVESEQPDIVLLDVMMPDLDGYAVCRAIRAKPATAILPVVMVTALDPAEERVKGLEAGADDFLSKPINQAELLARVRSLLRIKEFHDQVQAQARELADWNRRLEQRVADGVREIEQMGRLKRFLSPQIADLIVSGTLSGSADDPLKSHRREITVVFLDLRGFTAFTETADPEEVMGVLHEYHSEMGRLIMAHNGTIEHFAGDGIMIFFNDPVVIEHPAREAVNMAIQMQADFAGLTQAWKKRGYDLHMGIGIAQGYATLGTIGFEGRRDYGAIGSVCNLASRLCGDAKAGQILVSQKVFGLVEELVTAEPAGELSLKGFHKPVPAFNVTGLK
ncbi:MAG: response regulator [Betaproteobacteria bacterium]|nr:response regulator [Betaproteobacteria bacterium]